MVNSEEFGQRLQRVMEYYDLSAAAFADAIDVGRSSISHILSGRNKPSLDFVLKIVQSYPDVELYWLLNGKGNFPSRSEKQKPTTSPTADSVSPSNLSTEKKTVSPGVNSGEHYAERELKAKEIRKIVIFYNDGTFEAFEN
ncbi:MAG TPA: helix-turn-helix domain-containing protein [Gillisia sp.]|nr:helix-turn-helix domain-containing protein [Gillisia sp.]